MMTKKVFLILSTVVLSLGLLSPAQAYEMIIYQESFSFNPSLILITQGWDPPLVLDTSNSSGNYFASQTVTANYNYTNYGSYWESVGEGSLSASLNQSAGSGSTTFSLAGC